MCNLASKKVYFWTFFKISTKNAFFWQKMEFFTAKSIFMKKHSFWKANRWLTRKIVINCHKNWPFCSILWYFVHKIQIFVKIYDFLDKKYIFNLYFCLFLAIFSIRKVAFLHFLRVNLRFGLQKKCICELFQDFDKKCIFLTKNGIDLEI